MDFEVVFRVVLTLPKLFYVKLKYGRRFQFAVVQSFGRNTDIRISKNGKVQIGKETISRNGLFIRAESGILSIGDKCFFNTNCSITCMEEITIGKACQIANNVVIVDHDHDYRKPLGEYKTAPVKIGNHVWIGANCVILKGSEIGDGAVIGAGSVVKGKVKANTVYVQKRLNKEIDI